MSRFKKHLSGAGGGSSKTTAPVSTPDTLRSQDTVEFVIGLSEGLIKGPTNGNKSIMLGTTALQRADGAYNFDDVKVDFYPGEANPEHITFTLGGASNTHNVGLQMTHNTPITRETDSGQIDFIQIRLAVQSLYRQVNGGKQAGIYTDDYQFRIRYKPVDSGPDDWTVWTDGSYVTNYANPYYEFQGHDILFDLVRYQEQINWAASQQPGGVRGDGVLNINGKTTSTYIKEYRIPVERTQNGYTIEVMQLSPESDSPTSTADGTYHINNVLWESWQEIDATPRSYPNTAMLKVLGKATDQFNSIPQVSGIYDGLIVRVPTNYDAAAKTYTGTWDGSWKYEWTDNPVWLLYEAIHNTLWGWNAYTPVSWSQWEAYDLAQYCDHKLTNPQGVQVPRYTFNIVITDPMDGREFCRYMAGSFNSTIVDDDNGNIHVLMDRNDPAIAIVGKESIVGDFSYTYTDASTRYNDITAVFLNPDLNYAQDRRRVKNDDQIEQFGRVTFDYVSVGTTNEWEAVRKATRRLITSTTETESVNFKTNRIATFWTPYDVILVADTAKGQGLSGRFKSLATDGFSATLRDPIYLEVGVTYKIQMQGRDGVVERTITNTGGAAYTTLTWDLSVNFFNPGVNGPNVNNKAQFSIVQDGGDYGIPKPYRILHMEKGESDDDWTISALEINRLKYDAEDAAVLVGEPQYTFIKTTEPDPPTNVKIGNSSNLGVDGTFYTKMRVDFTKPENDKFVTDYEVRYRLVTETEWTIQNIRASGDTIDVLLAGEYEAEVRTKNVWQQTSGWAAAESTAFIQKGTSVSGGTIISATGGVNQITVKVVYPNQPDIRYAQIYASDDTVQAHSTFIGKTDSSTYIHTGLSAGVVHKYYWVKFEDNQSNVGPFSDALGVHGQTIQLSTDDYGAGTVTGPAIASGAISITKFASGIEPVGLYGSLPPVSGYTGPTVIFVGNQLYTYSTSGWESTLSDIADGSITVAKFAAGIEPIAIVSSLPSPSGYTGPRLVFNTTDGKTYRYAGGAFTAAVPTTDLTGTITSGQIASGAVGVAAIASGYAITQLVNKANINDGTVTGAINTQAYNANNGVLYRNTNGTATGWQPVVTPTTSLSGQVTDAQVAALAASKITGTLTNSQIADLAAAKITGTMTDAQLAAISAAKITGQIVSTQITDNSITTAKINAGAVTASQIAADTITAAQIAANAITASELAANSVTAASILAGTITATQIAANTITAANIAANTITAAQILAGTITSTQIAADTITAGNIAANAITSSEIAANAITAGKIAAGVVTATEIAASAITASKMAIAAFDNLIPGGDMAWATSGSDLSAFSRPSTPSGSSITVPSSTGWPSKNALLLTKGATAGELSIVLSPTSFDDTNMTYGIPSVLNDEFYFEAIVYQTATSALQVDALVRTSSTTIASLIATAGTNTSVVSSANLTASVTSTTFAKITGSFKNTTGTGKVYFRAQNTGANGVSVYLWNMIVRRKNAGELIVDGAISANKIVSGSITSTQIAADTITAANIAANAITSNELAANSVIAGKIAAAAISATEIAANAITASKLAIVQHNLFPDPNVDDAAWWTSNPLGGGSTPGYLNPSSGAWYIDNSTTSASTVGTRKSWTLWSGSFTGTASTQVGAPVIPGIQATQRYEVKARVYNASNKNLEFNIQWFDFNGSYLTGQSLFSVAAAAGSVNMAAQVQAPANAVSYRIYFENAAGAAFSGLTQVSGITVRLAAEASLIVDGTITAAKLVANSITAGQIAAGAISATEIAANAITASKIAAGSVDATKISVTNLAAINSNLGAITAGSLSIGGKFIVASDGTTTIQTSATGQRIVITNSLISVYDASNVLRVRMGIW